jgi:hypothetical protein
MEHVNERAKLFDPAEVSKKDENVLACDKCGCSFMELITVSQYKKDHSVILGQKPPTANSLVFYVLKCVKCQEVYEPSTIHSGSQNFVRKSYDQFLKQMEAKLPVRKIGGERL